MKTLRPILILGIAAILFIFYMRMRYGIDLIAPVKAWYCHVADACWIGG